MAYTEFQVAVTIWSLEVKDYEPCIELVQLCKCISCDVLDRSPVELYPRNEPILLMSQEDKGVFLSIDLSKDPTDQMEVVTISVRSRAGMECTILNLLSTIQARSEVKTALLSGNLGLPLP